MEIPSTYTSKFKVEKPQPGEPRTYREKLLSDFLLKINECRAAGGFNPITFGRLARMLKGYSSVQLKVLYDDCTCPHIAFSALFFSKIKKHT